MTDFNLQTPVYPKDPRGRKPLTDGKGHQICHTCRNRLDREAEIEEVREHILKTHSRQPMTIKQEQCGFLIHAADGSRCAEQKPCKLHKGNFRTQHFGCVVQEPGGPTFRGIRWTRRKRNNNQCYDDLNQKNEDTSSRN